MVRLSSDTRKVMRARDKARKEGSKNYKHLRNQALSRVRRDHVKYNLARIQRGGQSAAWKVVSEVCGKANPQGASLPLPGGCADNEDASNRCNNFYIEKVLKLRAGMSLDQPSPNSPQATSLRGFSGVSTATVKKALLKLQPTPAQGVDGIPINVFKQAWSPLALPLTHLVNIILSTATWPNRWKKSIVVPILKPGKPRLEVSSYRPISLLCAISKLVERVISDQLLEHATTVGHLPNEQHGFRHGRSVDTALASTLNNAALALQCPRTNKAKIAAYDFSAAFDTVDPNVLLSKLSWLAPHAKSLILSYLTGHSQEVLWNGARSAPLPVRFGVPQGSVLGPLLFILLTSDLPQKLTGQETTVTLYADDTSCFAGSTLWDNTSKMLTTVSESISSYSTKTGLHLNPSKTQFLSLTPSSRETLLLLGVTLDGALRFTEHHITILSDLRKRICAIRRLESSISRGPLLTAAGRALVIGKVQCSAWITRRVRLTISPPSAIDAQTQVALNDLARILIGSKRADRVPVTDLIKRSGLPTLNELVAKQSAINAWKANKEDSPLSSLINRFDTRTRGATSELIRPSSECIAAVNIASIWNSSAELRNAKTLAAARKISSKISKSVRFY